MRHCQRISERMIALATVALAAAMTLAPLASARPPGHTLRIGILGLIAPSFDPVTNPAAREFVEGLRELGYTPGHDVVFEYRSAQGNVGETSQLAAELANSKPDVLVTQGTGPTLAVAKATKTVPIVM